MDDDGRAHFEQVAAGLMEPLRRYLARRTDPATADDVLADTLLVCWRRLDDVPAEPLPWAYGVARRCLANAQRGERRQARLATRISVVDPPARTTAAGTDSSADAGLDTGLDTGLGEAMARLRPEDAELLRLWAWEQLTPAEIADVLEISPNAASIRLHRAREKLRAELRGTRPRKDDGTAGHEQSREGRTP